MLINGNTAFLIGYFGLVAIMLGFIMASFISSYKRDVLAGFFGTLKSMAIDPIFLGALGTALWSLNGKDFDTMYVAVIGFLAYKLVATEVILFSNKNGTYRYSWFTEASTTLNKWASVAISTRTLVALIGVGAFWFGGYYGLIDVALVPDKLSEIAGAWLVANGLPALTMLKNSGMTSILTPVRKVMKSVDVPYTQPKPVEQPALPAPVQTQAPVNPYPNRPAFVPFDSVVWEAMFKSYLAASPQLDADMGRNDASVVDSIAQSQKVFYPSNLASFASWRIKKYYDEFKADFGFEFKDSKAHWGDVNLVGDCPATNEETFTFKMPQSKKNVYQEMFLEEKRYENFAAGYNALGDKKIEKVLADGRYNYFQAYTQIWYDPNGFN
jgi:hypothetical protein